MDPRTALYIGAFVLSLAGSAFFAGSETALFSLGRIDLQAMREKGDRRGAILRSLRSQTSRLLAVLLVTQNLFMSAASATATALAQGWFGPRYGIFAAVIFSTLTIFVFAEMTPKAIAAASPVAFARAVAIPLSWMTKLLAPVAELCVRLTTRVLRVFGVPEHRPALTEEELKSTINLGADEGIIHRDERQLLHKVIEFGDKTVRDIMVPRTKIVALPETASFEDVKTLLREHKLSRLPVYRGTLDEIVGMLHAFDLFKLRPGDPLPVRPVAITPASRACGDLLLDMQRERRHLAVVLDEFGGTLGIATLEDLLEELVGEIFDEHDDEVRAAPAGGPTIFETDGNVSPEAIEERFGVELPPARSTTVAGLLVEWAGRIPNAGDRFLVRGLEFDVLEASPTRVERLVIRSGATPPVPLSPGGA